ncbi:hypothetical protein [Fischerella thermalis]|nr:hypothetical protein [Fischerella thermalis]
MELLQRKRLLSAIASLLIKNTYKKRSHIIHRNLKVSEFCRCVYK